MTSKTDRYAEFVEHPRYGRGPRITGLNPRPSDPGVQLHWMATEHDEMVELHQRVTGEPWPHGNPRPSGAPARRIPNTAIAADLARQTPASVAVTHYFDMERQCRDCGRPFLFFAQEQKHWYEELGFGLDSDCVRCVECRKQQHGLAAERETYESLFHIPDKSTEQLIRMAEACLALIEARIFTAKQTQRVRALLNAIPADADVRRRSRYARLLQRVSRIEST
jgi:hypothetical protein